MKDHIGKNCLVTTDAWFTAPDGQDYKAVWGNLKAIHEAGTTLGFIPNRSHANWFIEIGGMIIMGCQVLYFIACPEKPYTGDTDGWSTNDSGIIKYQHPTKIYISKEPKIA